MAMMLISPQKRGTRRGSVLLLTLMMIMLMTFEVALVSLVVLRGLGEEGMLASQSIVARRSAETAINQLETQIYTALVSTPRDTVKTQYALGGSAQGSYNNQVLQVTDPTTGVTAASNPPVYISAWIDTTDTRGNYFHLVGRARSNSVDLLVHRWRWIEPSCVAGLRTVLPSPIAYPGADNSLTAWPDGRIFFGAKNTNNYWTWHPATGLTTLVTSSAPFTQSATFTDPYTYRAYFAESGNSARLWTWSESTGLSVLVPAANTSNFSSTQQRNDLESSYAVASDGRMFVGSDGGQHRMYTYKEGSGLSVLVDNATNGADSPGENSVAVAPDGRVYFGEDDTSGSVWTWKESTGLTRVINGAVTPGDRSMAVGPDGRVFFGEDVSTTNARRFFTWKPGDAADGATAIVVVGDNLTKPGYLSSAVDSTGRVFFGGQSTSVDKPFYYWKEGMGATAVELIPATHGHNVGVAATVISANDRVFIGSDNNNPARVWTWDSVTGLSVLATGLNYAGSATIAADANGRVFFGEQGSGKAFRTWHKDTGMTTIISGGTASWGWRWGTTATPYGRVYFSTDSTTSHMYTWHKDTGLSVISSATGDRYGQYASVLVNSNGVFAFGQNTTGGGTGNMYYYTPPEACNP